MLLDQFQVESSNVVRGEGFISSAYEYQHNEVDRTPDGKWTVKPLTTKYEFRTDTNVPKLG